jgi:hypothetical protein
MAPPTKTENLPAIAAMHTGGKVAAIVPSTWSEVVQIASSICRANMAPKSYLDKQGNPITDKVAVAIMHGLEVGFTPMAALQSIAVINGMPSVYGDGLLALIRASGLLEDVEETVEWGKDGPLSATCKMWRKGEKSPSIQTYTRADAQNARLWGKVGPWTDHPARMLQWRARGWCGRDKFADVLRGLRMAEEVQDMIDVTPAAPVAEPTRADFVEKPAAPETPAADTPQATAPEADKADDKPPVTDVQDLNDIEFDTFKTLKKFYDFSDTFLQSTATTPAMARAWEKFYREKIKELATSENEGRRTEINDTLALYHAKLKEEGDGASSGEE